ncbi:MAG: hypothetical protein IJ799_04360, partial [Bacteroidales bacterium]|nr:hypothetical protein [Bacteroidales bacterium]
MKKFTKIFFTLALLPLMAVSCDIYDFGSKPEQYQAAEVPDVAQVYFATDLASSYNLKGNPGSLSIPVNRVSKQGALSVPVVASADNVFNVPSTVNFADGSATADLKITFDPAELIDAKDYEIELTLAEQTSDYGLSTYSFTA